jgi:hypothetical protein
MPSGVPDPEQAPAGHATHGAQCPLVHSESAVHQQATPAEVHAPPDAVTVLQAPTGQDQAVAADVSPWHEVASPISLPLQVPVHWPVAFTHLPLEQSASSAHRHAWVAVQTGAGESVVTQALGGAGPVLTLIQPYAPPPPPPPPVYDLPRSVGGPPFVGAAGEPPPWVPPLPPAKPVQVLADVVSTP